MVRTPSTMMDLGTKAPNFSLPDVDGKIVSLSDFDGKKALLVMAICNHCPYVKHVEEGLGKVCSEYQQKGVAVVGISSNDVENYPDDSVDRLKEQVARCGFTFPYLIDATQEVAKAYRAACTPDFFLFDAGRRLYYRGQMDSSRPGNGIPVTGEDLTRAVASLLAGRPAPPEQRPSLGCNIKWKAGNEPDYFRS